MSELKPETRSKWCCQTCFANKRGDYDFPVMFLCPTCGNKRCPKATNHELPCSGSNAPGQEAHTPTPARKDRTVSETPMTDLKDLARRVSELQGPSREVDALIEVELRRLQAYAVGLNDSTRAKWQAHPSGKVGDTHTTYVSPRYTASLDAAMTLVPEGAKLTFQNHGDTGGRSMWLVSPNERFISAATPALALCAAALIARSEA